MRPQNCLACGLPVGPADIHSVEIIVVPFMLVEVSVDQPEPPDRWFYRWWVHHDCKRQANLIAKAVPARADELGDCLHVLHFSKTSTLEPYNRMRAWAMLAGLGDNVNELIRQAPMKIPQKPTSQLDHHECRAVAAGALLAGAIIPSNAEDLVR